MCTLPAGITSTLVAVSIASAHAAPTIELHARHASLAEPPLKPPPIV